MRKLRIVTSRVIPSATLAVIFSLAAAACKDQGVSPNDPAYPLVTVGAPTDGLADAVRKVDLGRDDIVAKLPARIRDLAANKKEPIATGVMLRALAAKNKDEAANVGCDLLLSLPEMTISDSKPERPLLDAALIAIANGKGNCHGDRVLPRMGKDWCLPSFRCKDGGRIAPGAATDQKEPLCSKEDLQKEVTKELARPKEEVLAEKDVYYTERWALAALWSQDAVPPPMIVSHARRQYALTQVASPECGMGTAIGTPCHWDEAAIRDQICRSGDGPVHSFVRYDISDEKKTISNVVEASPP